MALALALSGAGCAAADSAGVARSPATALPPAQGAGAVVVTVRWPTPGRAPQLIPAATKRLHVAALRPGDPIALDGAILERTPGATESSATFSNLVPGPLDVSALARDSSGSVLAAGAAAIVVGANEIAHAALTLDPEFRPSITSLSPPKAVPGANVLVGGTSLAKAGAASLSVAVGGVRVASGDVALTPEGFVSFVVPAKATTSAVLVAVGGVPVTSEMPLVTIASLSLIPPATETFSPNGLVRFKVQAFDTAGKDIGDPLLALALGKRACTPAPCAGRDELNVLDLLVGTDAGEAVVTLGSGAAAATATVRVHALSPADLLPGMGPLPPVPHPSANPASPARAALGKQLFFDVKLSRSQGMSCASCHDPAKGWGDTRAKVGASGSQPPPRNIPGLIDTAYFGRLFWDGRAASLETAASAEMIAPGAMNAMAGVVEVYMAGAYGQQFQSLFGQSPPTVEMAGKALAAFIRTLVSPAGVTPFDRWAAGEAGALSQAAYRGLGAFLGKAMCGNCHTGPLFSDDKFHNIAIPGSGTTDYGRILESGDSADLGAFRTSGLRNVALTAPYFHDGSKATLELAIKQYTTFDEKFPNLSPLMPAIRVADADVADLEAFLRSLTATPSY
ncbi:MAG: hypothetical protein FJZ01_07325 [Candidatus Sericytochromatia bacterium]|nr:hypothetical protein [Candidatus Tanganyikabacteria bacterium]